MRQKKYPCCKKPIHEDDIWNAISDSGDCFSTTSKLIRCPSCGKNLIVYLNLESVEEE